MPKTILLVDDEPVARELTKRILEEKGYDIAQAQDGQEALAELGKKVPDLILLDVQMPTMNGYTFMMEKAKTPAYVKIPVVVLTAHNEVEPLFRRHGVRGYLMKPLKSEELLAKVQELLGPQP